VTLGAHVAIPSRSGKGQLVASDRTQLPRRRRGEQEGSRGRGDSLDLVCACPWDRGCRAKETFCCLGLASPDY
jgi:hypothetical protein